MEDKKFNGKAIYQTAGKAAEYSKWACICVSRDYNMFNN